MTAVSLENLTVLMTPEDLAAAVDMSDSVLVVIDVHKKWCGPCDAMVRKTRLLVRSLNVCSVQVHPKKK